MIDYDRELNAQQREAVLYDDGPSLVIAGAGSGKTRVLTYKLAHLIEQGYDPSKLMALTFTNKAANEMRERVECLVGGGVAKRMMVGTFHSVFARILRHFAQAIGFTRTFSIYDTSDSLSLLRKIVKDMQLDSKTYTPSLLLGRISDAKNRLISPEAYLQDSSFYRSNSFYGIPETGQIYKVYAALCKSANAMDFDDLLYQFSLLLRDNPDVLDICRERIDYLLIDEFQDTNIAQCYITQKLVHTKGKIFAVGDDAQSIYSFRGASIQNILNFHHTFPNSRLFKLEQNYRSTENIVNLANKLITKNKSGIQKTLFSERGVGEKTCLTAYDTAKEEATSIVLHIDRQCRMNPDKSYSDFAILYRTNAQSRLFEEQLNAFNIPYRVYGMTAFYARAEIKNILAYLRLLVNPHDDEAFARTLDYPKKGIGDKTQAMIRKRAANEGISLYDASQKMASEDGALSTAPRRKLCNYLALLDNVFALECETLFDKVSQIISIMGIDVAMNEDKTVQGLSRIDNVKEFLSSVRDFDRSLSEEFIDGGEDASQLLSPLDGLSAFLERVSLVTSQESDTSESLREKVTLMTVHAAKGLEFPAIYVTGMEEGIFPSLRSGDPLLIEEERRLFYVAITRACDVCSISYAKMRMINGQNEHMVPSSFLRELDPALIQKKGERASWEIPSLPTANRLFTRDRIDYPIKKKEVLPLHQSVDAGSCSLRVGSRIRYNQFGLGTVESITPNGDSDVAVVRYDDGTVRSLFLKYAKNIELLE